VQCNADAACNVLEGAKAESGKLLLASTAHAGTATWFVQLIGASPVSQRKATSGVKWPFPLRPSFGVAQTVEDKILPASAVQCGNKMNLGAASTEHDMSCHALF
jgi:hypothetical protein